jgi:hypothetical protein
MRKRCGRHHICSTWSDRARTGHHAAARVRFGVSDCGERHRLFIMGSQNRQLAAMGVKGGPNACDVAVPENREDAPEQRLRPGRRFDRLCGQEPNQSFCQSETQAHPISPFEAAKRIFEIFSQAIRRQYRFLDLFL